MREGERIESDSCFLAWETVNFSTNHCEWKKGCQEMINSANDMNLG